MISDVLGNIDIVGLIGTGRSFLDKRMIMGHFYGKGRNIGSWLLRGADQLLSTSPVVGRYTYQSNVLADQNSNTFLVHRKI